MGPETMNSSEGGVWVREASPCPHRWLVAGSDWAMVCGTCGIRRPMTKTEAQTWCYDPPPTPPPTSVAEALNRQLDLRTPHDRLEARVAALEAENARLTALTNALVDFVTHEADHQRNLEQLGAWVAEQRRQKAAAANGTP